MYDIVKFQIDLVILASSKNFVDQLHDFVMLFFFSRDFILATSGFFFRYIYKATGFFLVVEKCEVGREREKLIDGVKKGYCFFVIIYCGFC